MIDFDPQLIITGDIHLRLTIPECRLDDYTKAMKTKFLYLDHIQKKYGCPILDSGDFFDTWKVSPELEAWVNQNIPNKFWTIAGNHDLKNKSADFFEKSSLNVIATADKINILNNAPTIYGACKIWGFHWNFNYEQHGLPELSSFDYNIAVIHEMVYHDKIVYEEGKPIGSSVKKIFQKFKGFDLIISGHNHQSFAVQDKDTGQWLINPGSMGRMKSDQMEYEPSIFLFNIDKNKYAKIPYPIEEAEKVITRKHIEDKKIKEERYKAFVDTLNNNYEIGLSLKDNADNYFEVNKEDSDVKELVFDAFGLS